MIFGGVTLSLRGSYRTSALTLCMLGNFACFCILPASIPSRATIRPPAKRHSDGVLMARRYWPDITCLLGCWLHPPPPQKKNLSGTIRVSNGLDAEQDVLIRVQTVCKCYQQMTKSPLASKEVTMIRQQQSIRCIYILISAISVCGGWGWGLPQCCVLESSLVCTEP